MNEILNFMYQRLINQRYTSKNTRKGKGFIPMKKTLILLTAVMLSLGVFTQTSVAAEKGRGGAMGFIAGCCFGIRTAGAYNDGKEIQWREWVLIVPVVGFVFAIINGVEGAQGITTADLAAEYGSTYY
jgi:hypothetical protein